MWWRSTNRDLHRSSRKKGPLVADCYETLGPAENKCEDALAGARAFFMGFMQGEGRTQGTLFPVTLEELIPDERTFSIKTHAKSASQTSQKNPLPHHAESAS